MPSDGSEIFGPGRTWESVRRYTMAVCLRRWYTVDAMTIEDCVGDALVWGMTMWRKVPSSVMPDDPERTFRGARWAVSKRAGTLIYEHTERVAAEQEGHPFSMVAEYDRLPELAAEAIAELAADDREWDVWARDFLAGLSEAESAKRAGISQQAVSKRRKRGINRIAPKLGRIGGST